MGKQDKKWDPAAERDLCVAIILSNQEGDRIRCNWANVLDRMGNMGYGFTKDAISQHFTKVILKDVKNRHGDTSMSPSAKSTPQPKKTAPRPSSISSSKKKRGKADLNNFGCDLDGDDDEDDDTPRKKVKTENHADDQMHSPSVKAETIRAKRERSATVMDTESEFARWEAGMDA